MYKPMTGTTAGKRNRDMIEDYLKKNPGSTGVEVAEALNLSKPTVYKHLAFFQERPKRYTSEK